MRLKFLVVILPFEAFFTHVYNLNGGFPSVMEINNISVTNLITNNLISDHVVHGKNMFEYSDIMLNFNILIAAWAKWSSLICLKSIIEK